MINFFAKFKKKCFGNIDFVLKVRVKYEECIISWKIDGILILFDPNMFSRRIPNRWGREIYKLSFK